MTSSVTEVTSATEILVALVSGGDVDEVVVASFSAASTGTTTRGMEDSDVEGNVEVSVTFLVVVKFSETDVVVSLSAVSSGTTTRVSEISGTTVVSEAIWVTSMFASVTAGAVLSSSFVDVTSTTGISVVLVSDGNVDALFSADSTGMTISGMEDSEVEVLTTLSRVVKFSGAEVAFSFSDVPRGTTTIGARVSEVAGIAVDSTKASEVCWVTSILASVTTGTTVLASIIICPVTEVTSVALISGGDVDELVDKTFSVVSTGTTTRGMEDSDSDVEVDVSSRLSSVVKVSEAVVVSIFSVLLGAKTIGAKVSEVAGTTVDSAVAIC